MLELKYQRGPVSASIGTYTLTDLDSGKSCTCDLVPNAETVREWIDANVRLLVAGVDTTPPSGGGAIID